MLRRLEWYLKLVEQLFGRYKFTIFDHFNEGGFGTVSLLIKIGKTGDTLVTVVL